MHLLALRHAVPPLQLTQQQAWEVIRKSGEVGRLKPRSLKLLEKVLLGSNGIATRHFATEDPEALFAMHPGELNAFYEEAAPALAVRALEAALDDAGIAAADLDALVVCSCTGYLCPGPASFVAEQAGLREDAVHLDIQGMGCGAALPALRTASGFHADNPGSLAATIAVEISSAAFFLYDDPGALISLCLFADAAAAAITTGPSAFASLGEFGGFRSLHRPDHREKLRFTNHEGFLRNQLDRAVPGLAGEAVRALVGSNGHRPHRLICHPGGRDVLDAIEQAVPGPAQSSSREILRRYGNCSSPSVLLALEHDLAHGTEKGPRTLASFGAGFTCHAVELSG